LRKYKIYFTFADFFVQIFLFGGFPLQATVNTSDSLPVF